MTNKTSLEILRILQTKLTSSHRGVLYFSRGPLKKTDPLFFALDYFVNGALHGALEETSNAPIKMAMSLHFEKSFFVAQVTENQNGETLLGFLPKEGTILLMGDIPLKIFGELKTKASHLVFEAFNV